MKKGRRRMPEGLKFPKLRKFSAQPPASSCPDGTSALEYTNYDIVPPVTYRIEGDAEDSWRWSVLQSGWQISSCPDDRTYDRQIDAYHALKQFVTA